MIGQMDLQPLAAEEVAQLRQMVGVMDAQFGEGRWVVSVTADGLRRLLLSMERAEVDRAHLRDWVNLGFLDDAAFRRQVRLMVGAPEPPGAPVGVR